MIPEEKERNEAIYLLREIHKWTYGKIAKAFRTKEGTYMHRQNVKRAVEYVKEKTDK